MKLSATIQRNQKSLLALKKRVARINKDQSYVKVGLIGGSARTDGMSNPSIGVVHEFGSPENNIPARPWLRPPVQALRGDFNKRISEALSQELRGNHGALSQTLGLIGVKAVAEIKKYVTAGSEIPPPNAPRTLARKKAKSKKGATKAPRTLVDSSQMINAVTSRVVQGEPQKGSGVK